MSAPDRTSDRPGAVSGPIERTPGPSAEPGAGPPLWVLIPVKPLESAKGRLAPLLGSGRAAFATAMFRDVLAAVAQARRVQHSLVVTADAALADIATEAGCAVLAETGRGGLNAAVARGVEAIRQRGAGRILVLPADVPLLTGTEIDRLARAMEGGEDGLGPNEIGVVPSADRDGTNGLFLGARQLTRFRFGADSFRRHCEGARAEGRRVTVLESPEAALDIDEPRDVEEFLSRCERRPEYRRTQAWQFLCAGQPAAHQAARH